MQHFLELPGETSHKLHTTPAAVLQRGITQPLLYKIPAFTALLREHSNVENRNLIWSTLLHCSSQTGRKFTSQWQVFSQSQKSVQKIFALCVTHIHFSGCTKWLSLLLSSYRTAQQRGAWAQAHLALRPPFFSTQLPALRCYTGNAHAMHCLRLPVPLCLSHCAALMVAISLHMELHQHTAGCERFSLSVFRPHVTCLKVFLNITWAPTLCHSLKASVTMCRES